MRKKIIFIDIDGVLNSKASRKNSETDYYHDFISDENMRFLEYIVRAAGGAEIVLSSYWKFYWNRGKTQHDEAGYYMNRIFKGYGLEISDQTSDLDNDRDAEISQWIENNKNKIESYVILDDHDYNWSSCNKKHFVMTNDETGLDESSADRAIAILNGEMLEEMKDVNEEWSRVRDIIRNTVDDKNFNLYFKDLIPIGFIVDSKRLFITCRMFTKVLIEENMRFLEILDKAIFEVFGEIEYYIEDEDVEESGFTIVSEDTDAIESVSGIKIIYDPWATYNRFPHIKAVKMRKKLSSLLKEHPERIFKSESINSELFFRVLSIFLNVFELHGLRDLKISRKGNILEIYSIDTELRVDKFDTVKKIFLNCDYKKHLIRGYNIKKKYSSCPFYQHALVEEVEKFFINVDDYLTLYALINLSDVQIENVKDGRSTKIEFKSGFSFAENIENGFTDKNDGSYITYYITSRFSNNEILNTLQTTALLCCGLKVTFFDQEKGDCNTYYYKNVGNYLEKHTKSKCSRFPFVAKVKGGGKDRYNASYYNAECELAFNFTEGKSMSKSYYNYSLLEEDNCFINRFYELLSEKLNGWLEDKISYRLTKTDLKENCSFILKIQTDDDYEEWKPLRCVESRQMLSDMIADAFENFTYWLNCDVKQDELINLFFDIFADKIEREIEMYFPDGIK